ncbi:MAG: hypothetical protein R3346_00035 [Candidatus Spechtbacterales bacterium]|nr:hypothetical protein [Candidatus Spechtbacterales bacterium]
MKKKLETPKAIKEAFQKLDDLNTSPKEYSINTNFGYCCVCRDATEYHLEIGHIRTPTVVTCFGCKRSFKESTLLRSIRVMYTTRMGTTSAEYVIDTRNPHVIRMIPQEAQDKLKEILSRKGQRKLLSELLARKHMDAKNETENLCNQLAEAEALLLELETLHTEFVIN